MSIFIFNLNYTIADNENDNKTNYISFVKN